MSNFVQKISLSIVLALTVQIVGLVGSEKFHSKIFLSEQKNHFCIPSVWIAA